MVDYAVNHGDKLIAALLQHIEILVITLIISILLASLITVLSEYRNNIGAIFTHLFSIIYSVPSLALFALLIPVTGLGMKTAVIVLVAYNQYLLLGNFLTGLREVDPSIVEAATGLGMTRMQTLIRIKLPLSKRALFTGIRLAVVSTIGIATIAASINAGGLGSVLFDGLRTINTYKIVWGSLLAAGLAIIANGLLSKMERKI